MDKVEQIVCSKGTLYHTNDGYFYTQVCKRGSKLYLNCCKPQCAVKGVTDINLKSPIILFNSAEHNHGPNRSQFTINKLITKVVDRCNSETTSIKEIFDDEVSKLPDKIISKLSYTSFLKVLRLKHLKGRPLPIVKSITKYAKLLANEHFAWLSKTRLNKTFFIGVIGNHTLLFVSPTTKALTNENDITYIFSTNRTTNFLPKYFNRCTLVTILGIYDNKEIPFAFAIVKMHSIDAYRQLLQRIVQELPAWDPSSIIVPFDSIIRDAIDVVFPNSKVIGNWYHFSKDIRTRLFNLDLVPHIKQDGNLHTYTKMFIALPLLPAAELQLGFRVASRLILSHQNITSEFTTLLKFVQEYWLNGVTSEHLSVDYNPHRINNYCEEYTGFLVQLLGVRRCGKVHPTVITFTEGLGKIENMYSTIYTAAYNRIHTHGVVPKPLIKDIRISNAMSNYQNGRASLEEFLRMLSSATMNISEYDIDGDFPMLPCPKEPIPDKNLLDNENNLYPNEQSALRTPENDLTEEIIIEEVFFSDEQLNESTQNNDQNCGESSNVTESHPLCKFCVTNICTIICIPCGHFGMCNACIGYKTKYCTACSKIIQGHVQVCYENDNK